MDSLKERRLTQRALDAGESARFSGSFFASAFFRSDGVPPPAPAQVTQTVGRLAFFLRWVGRESRQIRKGMSVRLARRVDLARLVASG